MYFIVVLSYYAAARTELSEQRIVHVCEIVLETSSVFLIYILEVFSCLDNRIVCALMAASLQLHVSMKDQRSTQEIPRT